MFEARSLRDDESATRSSFEDIRAVLGSAGHDRRPSSRTAGPTASRGPARETGRDPSPLRRWLGRSSPASALSERVRAAIATHQDESERLIGWLQLAVVLTFSALYLVSPPTPSRFDLVPGALAIYLLLTAIRIAWARLTRLPGWSLVLSIVFDMGLLMTLIWSFHLKYDQPPSFYLKAPTLLYVFIFIALRALRFDARFVVLSGIVAAFGWAVLLGFVVLGQEGPAGITRDYVAYLTSNAVLIGAEIDKIVSILMVTAILGVALTRGRRLLTRAVTGQTAARELSRFFAPEVAMKIKDSDDAIHAGYGELRRAAILCLDIRRFTIFAAEASPEAVMRLLSDYQARIVPIIRRHGGSIDKFLGDGILATFGATAPSASHAADALRALDEVIEATERWSPERADDDGFRPTVNGAVATGCVLFGAVGDESRLEFTVIGEAVNLAAKLEKANKQLRVNALCDAATYDLAITQGYAPPRPKTRHAAVAIAGAPQPIDLVVMAD